VIDFDVVTLSRAQFALTALYHFLFVPLTLGLSMILVIMESVYVMTGKEVWKRMTRFWGVLFGINFAMGVATGITMEFQFGTNWAYYSHYVGDIFGAPLASDGAASDALATARTLRDQLRRLPMVDFGIGVSAGPVFAGNIGAENRYEYTVVGDAVNEAARLADFAKTLHQRIACSAAAIERADASECRHWLSAGETELRGRAESTSVFTPAIKS